MVHRAAMPESEISRDRHAISASNHRVSACGHAIKMRSASVVDRCSEQNSTVLHKQHAVALSVDDNATVLHQIQDG